MVVNPYTQEQLTNSSFLREFSESVESEELVWHRDREDREIILKEGSGWYLQLDNKLPILMIKKCNYSIPKETWHRIISKNNTKLIIEVRKYK